MKKTIDPAAVASGKQASYDEVRKLTKVGIETKKVPLQNIVVMAAWNDRTDFSWVPELAAGIVANKGTDPIFLRPLLEDGTGVLVDGETRYQAYLYIKEHNLCDEDWTNYMLAIIAPRDMTELDYQYKKGTSNNGKQYAPFEEAHYFKTLLDAGESQADIANRLGHNRMHVSNRIVLANCPRVEKEEFIDSDVISVTEWVKLAKAIPDPIVRMNRMNEYAKRPHIKVDVYHDLVNQGYTITEEGLAIIKETADLDALIEKRKEHLAQLDFVFDGDIDCYKIEDSGRTAYVSIHEVTAKYENEDEFFLLVENSIRAAFAEAQTEPAQPNTTIPVEPNFPILEGYQPFFDQEFDDADDKQAYANACGYMFKEPEPGARIFFRIDGSSIYKNGEPNPEELLSNKAESSTEKVLDGINTAFNRNEGKQSETVRATHSEPEPPLQVKKTGFTAKDILSDEVGQTRADDKPVTGTIVEALKQMAIDLKALDRLIKSDGKLADISFNLDKGLRYVQKIVRSRPDIGSLEWDEASNTAVEKV
jgi:hypothetical protein